MLVMDNTSIVRALGWIFAVEVLNVMLDASNEIGLDLAMDEQVIRRNAGLSGVDKFAPSDAFGCTIKVNIAINYTGAFSAQF